MSGDVIELLIYHQPGVKLGLTLHPFGILGYVAGHSLTLSIHLPCLSIQMVHPLFGRTCNLFSLEFLISLQHITRSRLKAWMFLSSLS